MPLITVTIFTIIVMSLLREYHKFHVLINYYKYILSCWLSYESGFIWSFIAPVILIIIVSYYQWIIYNNDAIILKVNIGFFIMCIVIMKRHQQKQIHRKKLLQTGYDYKMHNFNE